MSDMQTIELLAAAAAEARGVLAERVQHLQDSIDALTRAALPEIRQAVRAAAGDLDRLRAAIEAAPELFEKPRTRVLNGIRCGYMKQRGEVSMADEAKTIERIRSLLPKDQAALLIRTRESVHKPAVYDLTAADLKRLGISIAEDHDAVYIKLADSAVDKVVAALLKGAEDAVEAA